MRFVLMLIVSSLALPTFALANVDRDAELVSSPQLQAEAPARIDDRSVASGASAIAAAKQALFIGLAVYFIVTADDLWAWLDDEWVDGDR